MNLQNLHAPFPPNEIEWRVGSTKQDKSQGLALAYLTARHVMERLDEVCGIEGWQDRYEFHGKRTVCYLSLRINGEWVTKADGAGDSDVEAEKGAISDALKRAAVKWGIGRYLYSLGNTWVDIEQAGKSYRIVKREFPRLEKMMADKYGLPPSDMGNVNIAAAEAAIADEPLVPKTYAAHLSEITTAGDMAALKAAIDEVNANKALRPQDKAALATAKDTRKAQLTNPEVPPNFDNLQQGGERHPSEYLRN